MAADRHRRVAVADLDVARTLRPFGVFRSDPTHRWWSTAFARAVRTPSGPATVRFDWSVRGEVAVDAWGPGADWTVDRAPGWLGSHDDTSGFDPSPHPGLATAWRRVGRWRLGASGLVWQELATTILGQRVTSVAAARHWRAACLRWGAPAPGPLALTTPPAPERLSETTYVELHRLGVERRRADTLVRAARHAARLEEAAALPVEAALDRLAAVSGIGPWTATATVAVSHGAPDVVVLGDYGIPTVVSHGLTGSSERVGDDRMLELLEPFRGHRWRVVRLLSMCGGRPPRRAPRARNPRIEAL